MKRYHSPLAIACIPLLAVVVLAASCTTDDDGSIPGNDSERIPVLFTAAIQTTADSANAATPATTTRTAPGADGAQAVWTADDRIAVFMLPKGGKIPADTLPAAHNVPYSIDPATGEMTQAVPMIPNPATGTTVPGVIVPMYYPMTHDEVDFVAYYPYDPALVVNGPSTPAPYMRGLVVYDQTTPEKQLRSDYLFSDNARGIRRSKDAVSLRFRHLNAKLRLDITLAEGLAGGKVTAVKLSGIPGGVQFDMRDGSVNKLYPSSNAVIISCLPLPSTATGTGAAATFTALVPPHSGADFAGRQITVTVNGEDYIGSLPDADVYRGNTMYAYPVRVTHHGVTIGAPNADVPWTDTKALPKGYDLTVGNETELRAFAKAVNSRLQINGKPAAEAKVLQTTDIELTKEWVQIGYNGNPFRGTYNGDGHTITGLTIRTAPAAVNGGIYVGLFGYIENAVLTGIHLRKVEIGIQAGSSLDNLYVGSIAGSLYNSTLSLCSATGKVYVGGGLEKISAGGIAGYSSRSTTISRSRVGVEIKVATTNIFPMAEVCVGEIAGYNYADSFILSCEAQGRAVTAKGGVIAYAGGIIGWNEGLIAFCRTGANTVTAQIAVSKNCAGGLVGYNSGYLYSCYSRATATATGGTDNWAGAIVGTNIVSDRVQHCYGTGSIGPGTSGLAADPDNIVYSTSPSSDAIYDVMKGYTGIVESVTFGGVTVYPYATRYDPAAYPAHSITPVRVKWGPGVEAWQRGINTTYPEINMEYGGEDAAAAP